MTRSTQFPERPREGDFQITKPKKLPPRYLAVCQGAAIVSSFGAGFSAFWGVRDFFTETGGIIGWLLPLSFATVVTVVLAVSWHMLLEGAANA